MKRVTRQHIAKLIKALRKLTGYNQEDFADWIGCHRTTYLKKENGKTALFAEELLTILENVRRRGSKKKGTLKPTPARILEDFGFLSPQRGSRELHKIK